MDRENLTEIFDEIAQELITADPNNLQDVGTLLTCCQKISDAASAIELHRIQNAADIAASLLKDCMLDDQADRDSLFSIMSETVSAMQLAVRPGHTDDEIVFPEAIQSQMKSTGTDAGTGETGFMLPAHVDESILQDFLSEQDSVLQSIEEHLLKLEKGAGDEALADLKRIFHTLKGEAGVFELDDVAACCHAAEDMLGDDYAQALPVDKLLEIKDWLRTVYEALHRKSPIPKLDMSLINKTASAASDAEADGSTPVSPFTLPEYLDESLFNDFIDDQSSVLENMESCLLKIEQDYDVEAVADLKRIFHTLKGESGIFQLNDVEKICHAAEDFIEESDDSVSVEILLKIKDWLKLVFDALQKRKEHLPLLNESILAALQKNRDTRAPADDDGEERRKLNATKQGAGDRHPSDVPLNAPDANPVDTAKEPECIQFSADLDLLSDFVSEVKEHIDNIDNRLLSLENNPDDKDLLNAVFRVFHTIKGAAGFMALDEMARLAHTTENLLDLARKSDIVLEGVKVDVIFEAVDMMKNLVGTIENAISGGESCYYTDPSVETLIVKIQNVIEGNDLAGMHKPDTSAAAKTIAQERQPVHQVAAAHTDEPQVAQAVTDAPEKEISSPVTATQQVKIKESIKVDSENLDKLIDSIGELVIIESMIRQESSLKNKSGSMLRNIAQMDKITRELQQLGMSLRMIPVKGTFQKMARVVRDLAKKSGKKIDFVTRGEDTMLDKSVVDRIGDPLIHLVRNSVDHGIESVPQDRIDAGKNETGTITLTAFHKGGNIYIEIIDDGRGLNKEAIMKKALEKGIIQENQTLSDREIYNLIFQPGFSTAKKVTDVSGRGVGMDVVRRTIEDLRGNIEIISEPGRGSTISLRLPLTLAIIDGMLVGIGDERYIIPTLSIVESIRPKRDDISTIVNRGEMIKIRENLIPLFRLADIFQIQDAKRDPVDGIVIVVEDSGKMTGLFVDELLGQQSTVIKSLGASLKGIPGVSGGSILSDGRVGIILDIAGLVKLATVTETVRRDDTVAVEEEY